MKPTFSLKWATQRYVSQKKKGLFQECAVQQQQYFDVACSPLFPHTTHQDLQACLPLTQKSRTNSPTSFPLPPRDAPKTAAVPRLHELAEGRVGVSDYVAGHRRIPRVLIVLERQSQQFQFQVQLFLERDLGSHKINYIGILAVNSLTVSFALFRSFVCSGAGFEAVNLSRRCVVTHCPVSNYRIVSNRQVTRPFSQLGFLRFTLSYSYRQPWVTEAVRQPQLLLN